MNRPIVLSSVGCCLVDSIYDGVSFTSGDFKPFISRKAGDGGLTPGHLILEEDFDGFTGRKFRETLPLLVGDRQPVKVNVGGPCVVAEINAAQLLNDNAKCFFYGCCGDDDNGRFLLSSLGKTPLHLSKFRVNKGSSTASTTVLSDPEYDNGNGERIFINTIGASWQYHADELDDDFFASDIVLFGGTALVPDIHSHLDSLLAKSKQNGCFTVVSTVFDFRSEKEHPDCPWKLGANNDSYKSVDLIITDYEEALRLSGKNTVHEALDFLKAQGVGAAVVTHGSKDISLFASGKRFQPVNETLMPVSAKVSSMLKQGGVKGDTTGCGDNFAGGVIASVATQLHNDVGSVDLVDACRWGVVSGGFACFYIGGTWFEKCPGEKLDSIMPFYDDYFAQTKNIK